MSIFGARLRVGNDKNRMFPDMSLRRQVVTVLFEDFLLLDLAGPLGAFEITNTFVTGGYDIRFVSAQGGRVRSSSGLVVETDRFEDGAPVDLLLVPGGPGTNAATASSDIIDLIQQAAKHADQVASVCSGAFLFAAAGLLDGRRATTHWGECQRLQKLHHDTIIDQQSLFVRDGNVWTSAGITAGIDLTLAIIERDHGFAVAREVARALVVDQRRPAGRPQLAAALDLQKPEGRFTPVLEWARQRLSERLDVERLAERCGLSPRQFSRAFTAAIGITPAKAIERMRVDQARGDVAAGQEPLDVIARRHGFGTAARMRRAFARDKRLPAITGNEMNPLTSCEE